MPQRIKKMISFSPDEIVNLESVCKDTGLNQSEVIRQLIAKAARDKYCREIITNQDYWDKIHAEGVRKIGRTSHNVQCEKKDAGGHPSASVDSSINQDNDNEWERELQRTIEIAKTPWVDQEW